MNPGLTKQGPVPDSDGFVLIDIENDIREENNVIEQHATVANEPQVTFRLINEFGNTMEEHVLSYKMLTPQ